jgi:hypothetical protein
MATHSESNDARTGRVGDEAVVRALEAAVDDPPRFVVRRLGDEFRTLYDRCESIDVVDLCERLYAYSRALDRFLAPGTREPVGVDYTTTWVDSCKVVYTGLGRRGFFVGLDPANPVVPVVEALGRLLERVDGR